MKAESESAQGRQMWQGEPLDGVWFDAEPSLEISSDGLTRTKRDRRVHHRDLRPAKA